MKKIKIDKDYYEEGTELFKKKSATIHPGVTVLVGCNGTGKTTLLYQISNFLKKEKIPHIRYDNLTNGGNGAAGEALSNNDYELFANLKFSSEGESIMTNLSVFAARLLYFVKTGNDKANPFFGVFKQDEEKMATSNERWILLDAIDSGTSIDNIVEIKHLFNTILENNFGKEIYIIVSANSYEMTTDEQCYDVYNGKYITFSSYEEYREFIIDSRRKKDRRYNTA